MLYLAFHVSEVWWNCLDFFNIPVVTKGAYTFSVLWHREKVGISTTGDLVG